MKKGILMLLICLPLLLSAQELVGKVGNKVVKSGETIPFPKTVFVSLDKGKSKDVYHAEMIEIWVQPPGTNEWRIMGGESGMIKIEKGIYLKFPKTAKAAKAIEIRVARMRKETPEGEIVDVKVEPLRYIMKKK